MRREARECTVQILFQLDLNPQEDLDVVFQAFWEERACEPRTRQLAEEWVRGVSSKRPFLDEVISRHAEHWSLGRMATTDRNVLRLAVYEMYFCADIPAIVSINEAVDLAKYFNSNESGRFVNGILDSARKEHERLQPRHETSPGAAS
jgi:N utilization substance protein B